MKNLKYILVTFFALALTTSCVDDEMMESPLPPVVGGEVKLNEIMSTGDPDWIELYNTTTEDIDITDYVLGDSNSRWSIPPMTIPANGFVTFDCDGLDANGSTNFKISSGGETVVLFNAEAELIDEITTPDMSAEVGLTYGREIDGAENWVVMSPSKGLPNSNTNEPPVITADDLTEFDEVYEISVSDADGLSSVKLVLITDNSVQSLDMVLIGGEYKISVPRFELGTKVENYVIATDNTGLVSYYPETAPEMTNSYYVTDGNAIFTSVSYMGAEAGNLGEVTFNVEAYDNVGVEEVKLYYVLPGFTVDDKISVQLTLVDGEWTGVIPEQPIESVVKYYLRAKNDAGNKSYYPLEDGSFDHDDLDTWPSYMVGEAVIVNGFSLFTNSNPVPDADLDMNVHIAYDNGDVEEVKLYYVVNYDPATYDGSQRVTIEWAGDLPTSDDMYNFSIPNVEFASGDTVKWYMRAKDGAGEKQYFTRGQDADFDKDVLADWDQITIL